MNARWIEGLAATDKEWEQIESILATRGWMSLNRQTSRIRVYEDDEGFMLGFFVFQLVPMAGPMYVSPAERGGMLAGRMAFDMLQFLVDAEARGCIIIAESPHVPTMCEHFGMSKIVSPVFTTEKI